MNLSLKSGTLQGARSSLLEACSDPSAPLPPPRLSCSLTRLSPGPASGTPRCCGFCSRGPTPLGPLRPSPAPLRGPSPSPPARSAPPPPNCIIVFIIIVIRVTGKLQRQMSTPSLRVPPASARQGARVGGGWRRRGRLVRPLASAPLLRQPQLRVDRARLSVDRARLRNLIGATFSISPWPRCSRPCSAPTRARPPGSRSASTLGRKT